MTLHSRRRKNRKSLQRKRQQQQQQSTFLKPLLEQLEDRRLLAMLVNMGTPTDVIYNLPATADLATLTDNGADLTLDAPTFDATTFTKPTGSLTINGGVGDVLTVTNSIDIANADLTLNLPDIVLDDDVDTGTGAQTYNGDFSTTDDASLTASTATFNGTVDGTGIGTESLTIIGDAAINADVGAGSP